MCHRSSASLANFFRTSASSRSRRCLWQPILKLLILNLRPRTTAANYAKVWTPQGSPITAITRAQCAGAARRLRRRTSWLIGGCAMAHGRLPERLAALKDTGCDRILLAPLYPQYSAATNATVVDAANATLAEWRWQPALRTLPPYYDNPDHIAALAQSVRDGVAALDFVPQLIVTSFHGMPKRTLDQRRSLSLPVPENRAAVAGCARRRRADDTGQGYLPVALRPGGMAEAVYRWRRLKRLAMSRVSPASPWFVRAFRPIASKRSRKWRWKGVKRSWSMAARTFAYVPCLNATDTGIEMLRTLLAP